ncbi:MAG: hypothetical protein Q7R54_00965 [bacterium]|nr:hypothetical protein [bacterium]
MSELIIDCDVDPFVPPHWKVKKHQKGGQWQWNPDQIVLRPTGVRETDITCHKHYEVFAGYEVLNANVLDFLLAHRQRVPELWRGKLIMFPGTIFEDIGAGGGFIGLMVNAARGLAWENGEWISGFKYLENGWPDTIVMATLRNLT